MKKEAKIIKLFTGLLVIIFTSSTMFFSKSSQGVSALAPISPFPTTAISTSTPTPIQTLSPTVTPTLITGVLNCNTVAAGVTCTNNGSYLDYNINIVVTGLTGGATAGDITIGTYTRSTSGGEMGMMSKFVHSETSGWPQNTVFSQVAIQPFDAAGVGYAGFTSSAGINVSVANQVSDWRYIGGSGGWPNTLHVGGDVNYIITGYSIVGHIYLFSNQSFVTGTPTSTSTSTPIVTPTPTNNYAYNRTLAVAYADQWAHEPRNGNYPNYGVDADGDNCDDCTNYLSQVLEVGGIPQLPGANDKYHWYTYRNIFGLWRGSKSWAATDLFNDHASQFQGTRYEYYPSGPSNLSAGDFFLMDLPTNPLEAPDHARIIVGIGTVMEGDHIGETMLLVNQHCIDRKRVRWDYRLPQNVLIWAWHVVY